MQALHGCHLGRLGRDGGSLLHIHLRHLQVHAPDALCPVTSFTAPLTCRPSQAALRHNVTCIRCYTCTHFEGSMIPLNYLYGSHAAYMGTGYLTAHCLLAPVPRRTYIRPNATGLQMLRMSQYIVFAFGIFMGVIAIILNVIGLPLGFVYETMGVLIGSAVVPIACCLMWKKTKGVLSLARLA